MSEIQYTEDDKSRYIGESNKLLEMQKTEGWKLIEDQLKVDKDNLIESLIAEESEEIRAKIWAINYLFAKINSAHITADRIKKSETKGDE